MGYNMALEDKLDWFENQLSVSELERRDAILLWVPKLGILALICVARFLGL